MRGLTDPTNLGEVTPTLWRSGRYSARGLTALVERTSIRVVVDLRDHPADILSQRTYERIGVTYHRVPVDEFQGFTTAAYEQVLALITGNRALIHCYKGAHRTGSFCALYRMREQGWLKMEAWTEQVRYGFGVPSWHQALYDSVYGDWRAG